MSGQRVKNNMKLGIHENSLNLGLVPQVPLRGHVESSRGSKQNSSGHGKSSRGRGQNSRGRGQSSRGRGQSSRGRRQIVRGQRKRSICNDYLPGAHL